MKLQSRVVPALVLLLLVIQLLYPNRGWMILLSGLGVAWLISYLWARSLRDGLQLERDMRYGWRQVGDQLQERITVVNGGWAPALWVRVFDQSDMKTYDISTVTDVQSRKFRHWSARGICLTRGLYTLGPTALIAGDPIGLYSVRVDYPETANMVIAPQLVSLPEIEIAPGGRFGEGKSTVRGFEQTVTSGGVRQYVAGDSLRFVHWPTTARKAEPYVHVFDNQPSSDSWILLDMDPGVHIGDDHQSTEEYGVILAASLLNRAIKRDQAAGLISRGDKLIWEPPGVGEPHLWKALRSLATLHLGGPPLAEVLDGIRHSLEARVNLVIITPSLSTEWLGALQMLQRAGAVPTVILIDPTTFGGFGDIQHLRDRLIALGIAHYTIGSDLLEPETSSAHRTDDWWMGSSARSAATESRGKLLWRKLSRTLRIWFLMFLLFYGTVTALGDNLTGVDRSFLWFMAGSGLASGWIGAGLRIPGWLAAPANLVLGVGLAVLRVGRLESSVGDLLSEYAKASLGLWSSIFGDAQPPDLSALTAELRELAPRVEILGGRVVDWVGSLTSARPTFDPVAVVFAWGVVLWAIAVWAMWAVIRNKQPMVGVLPAIALVGVTFASIGAFSYDLVLMLGAAIALNVLIHHDVLERGWERVRLFYDATIRPKVLVAAMALALALMGVAIVTPTISLESIEQTIRNLLESPDGLPVFAPSIGLPRNRSSQNLSTLLVRREAGLPNSHLLGAGVELSEQVVARLQVINDDWDELRQSLGPAQDASLRYLRAVTYDRYVSTGWQSSESELVAYRADQPLQTTWPDNHWLLREQIELIGPSRGLFYSVGIPLEVDRDLSVAWRERSDERQVYDSFGATIGDDRYAVLSAVPAYTEVALRAALPRYPAWIADRYLALPASVPESVLILARDLTATEPTPYDRALAIEAYLRQYPYSLDVTLPPAGADIAEHFLFSLQRGYCDYYATAMTVLARAAGMPARMAIGYVVPDAISGGTEVVVTADQAHAWPEIYFPEWGWIGFEPTAGVSPIDRPTEASVALPIPPSPRAPSTQSPLAAGLAQLIEHWDSLLLAAILLSLTWLLWREGSLNFMATDRLLRTVFERLNRMAGWIDLEIEPGTTASELIDQIDFHMLSLARFSRWEEWLLEARGSSSRLLSAWQALLFAPQTDPAISTRTAAQAYRRLRLRMLALAVLLRAYRRTWSWTLFWSQAPIFQGAGSGED